jgi:hypothetical protein
MIKKLALALTLAGLASSSAFAVTNAGFEAGTTGWNNLNGATLQSVLSGTSVSLTDDFSPATYSTTIDAVSGTSFGLLTVADPAYLPGPGSTVSTQAWSLNLSGPNSNAGDMFYMRLLTMDSAWAGYDDAVTVTFNGTTSYSLSAATMGGLGHYDTGWMGYAMPTGTQNIMITTTNYFDVDGLNKPIVALDFAAAAPVPEPESMAMMLAGLGALGFVARRRKSRA